LIWKIPVLIADRKQPAAFSDLLLKLLLVAAAVELNSVLAEVTTIIVSSLHEANEISKPQ
jgi:hypothetical protein